MNGHLHGAIERLRRYDTRLSRRSGRRRILVDGRTPVNFTMVAPVVKVLACDPRIDCVFTASEEPARMGDIYRHANGVRLMHPLQAALAKFDAYLASDFMWAWQPRGTKRIQMFHGVGGKYGFDAPTRSMREWDRLFFVNERRLRNFIAAGAIDADSPAICLIGMPKVDCLVDGTFARDTALSGLGLDPGRPTVLYAPTWSPASSLNALGVELVTSLLQLPVNIVVKLHDRSLDVRERYSGGVDWASRLKPLLPHERGALATDPDISPCLVAADVMITDHSSAGFEFLLRDKPLVRIHRPELIELASIHQDYVSLLTSVAESTVAVADTVAAVERGLADPSARSAERRRIAAELFYRPGSATSRCVDALYAAIELDGADSVSAWRHARYQPSA